MDFSLGLNDITIVTPWSGGKRQTEGLLLRNFTSIKGFVGGMYLIPLFLKRG